MRSSQNGIVVNHPIIADHEITSPAATAADSAAHQEYSLRLKARQTEAAQLQRKHLWLGNARIAVFIAILIQCWITGKTGSPSAYWLFVPIVLFIVLVMAHRRVVRAMNMAKRAVAIYNRGLARIEDRWSGSGQTGDEFKDPLHLYAEDLDILGQGSLFQLLSTARTNMGKQCLAHWLLTHAEIDEISNRQAAVAELKSKLDLREDLAVTGESEFIAAKPQALIAWAQEESGLQDGRWWAFVLAVLSIAALIFGFRVMWTPFVLLLLVNGVIMFRSRHRLEKIFAGVGDTHKDLDSLALLLRSIEAEQFESPMLQQLQARLLTHGLPPSVCIARLDTLADLDDSRHNWFVRILDIPLLYSLQIAFALERWRRTYGSGIEAWLDIVGELEALASVAAYAYEHPHDPFPEFAPPEADVCFHGEALGHPLLPAEKCVRNDVRLGGNSQVLLVSGSNMSGKSTYLRVVGINAVLAMVGAPVRARRLRLSRVAVGASMRVSDSLQKGISHFYAEIKRLRQVVDLSSARPALFLLDEVLQGTNSHDRRVGTEGVLRTLVRNHAIGLVTTHDLALTSLEEVFPDRVRNAHFQERFEDDKLSFDYCLRPGVVTTSNGVELMKSIGLDIS
ncbi:MAG TPA: mismatch repair protein [Candidatus Angelobacter sp.]|nr:mismatch repair protein [Candidatus Angelobacter sp.]